MTNRPARVDIMIDGQKPLDMWTYEELSAERANLMDQMNALSLRVLALQKQIAVFTPYINRSISRLTPEEREALARKSNPAPVPDPEAKLEPEVENGTTT